MFGNLGLAQLGFGGSSDQSSVVTKRPVPTGGVWQDCMSQPSVSSHCADKEDGKSWKKSWSFRHARDPWEKKQKKPFFSKFKKVIKEEKRSPYQIFEYDNVAGQSSSGAVLKSPSFKGTFEKQVNHEREASTEVKLVPVPNRVVLMKRRIQKRFKKMRARLSNGGAVEQRAPKSSFSVSPPSDIEESSKAFRPVERRSPKISFSHSPSDSEQNAIQTFTKDEPCKGVSSTPHRAKAFRAVERRAPKVSFSLTPPSDSEESSKAFRAVERRSPKVSFSLTPPSDSEESATLNFTKDKPCKGASSTHHHSKAFRRLSNACRRAAKTVSSCPSYPGRHSLHKYTNTKTKRKEPAPSRDISSTKMNRIKAPVNASREKYPIQVSRIKAPAVTSGEKSIIQECRIKAPAVTSGEKSTIQETRIKAQSVTSGEKSPIQECRINEPAATSVESSSTQYTTISKEPAVTSVESSTTQDTTISKEPAVTSVESATTQDTTISKEQAVTFEESSTTQEEGSNSSDSREELTSTASELENEENMSDDSSDDGHSLVPKNKLARTSCSVTNVVTSGRVRQAREVEENVSAESLSPEQKCVHMVNYILTLPITFGMNMVGLIMSRTKNDSQLIGTESECTFFTCSSELSIVSYETNVRPSISSSGSSEDDYDSACSSFQTESLDGIASVSTLPIDSDYNLSIVKDVGHTDPKLPVAGLADQSDRDELDHTDRKIPVAGLADQPGSDDAGHTDSNLSVAGLADQPGRDELDHTDPKLPVAGLADQPGRDELDHTDPKLPVAGIADQPGSGDVGRTDSNLSVAGLSDQSGSGVTGHEAMHAFEIGKPTVGAAYSGSFASVELISDQVTGAPCTHPVTAEGDAANSGEYEGQKKEENKSSVAVSAD